MATRVSHDEVVRMLRRAAESRGLTLRRFYELGRRDKLDDPGLRDLWLIWGELVSEEDLEEPTPTA